MELIEYSRRRPKFDICSGDYGNGTLWQLLCELSTAIPIFVSGDTGCDCSTVGFSRSKVSEESTAYVRPVLADGDASHGRVVQIEPLQQREIESKAWKDWMFFREM